MASTLKLSLVLLAVDRATAVVRAVNRTVERLTGPAQRVGQAWGNLTGLVRGVAGAMAVAGAAGAGAFFGFKRVADEVDRINDQARQLGMTTQRFQELGFAAQMNGSSAGEMAQALEFLSRNMVAARDGSEETAKWLRLAGITAKNLADPTFSAADAMERMAETYQRVGDKGRNAQIKLKVSTELLGRGGASLNQMLNQGKQTIREYAAEANRLGIVLDDKTVGAMQDFNDEFDRARLTVFGAMANALRAITPAVGRLVGQLTDWVVRNRELIATRVVEWFGRMERSLPKIITALGALASVTGSLLIWMDQVADAVGGWENIFTVVAGVIALKAVVAVAALTKAVMALTVAAAASPFGWLAAAVAFAYALAFHLDRVVAIAERINRASPEWFKRWTLPGRFFGALEDKGRDTLNERATERVGTEKGRGTNRGLNFGGTLKIEIDGNGQPRVRSMIKDDPNAPLDFELYSGRQMVTR